MSGERRRCPSLNDQGLPCQQAPLHGRPFCFWHDPENEEAAREARRVGGVNRKREQTLASIYDVQGVDSIEDIQRFIEIGLSGLLALDNSVPRNRSLFSGALAALKVYETGELAKKVEQLTSVLDARLPRQEPKRKRWGIL